jgi:hypothetical protein
LTLLGTPTLSSTDWVQFLWVPDNDRYLNSYADVIHGLYCRCIAVWMTLQVIRIKFSLKIELFNISIWIHINRKTWSCLKRTAVRLTGCLILRRQLLNMAYVQYKHLQVHWSCNACTCQFAKKQRNLKSIKLNSIFLLLWYSSEVRSMEL